MDTDYRKSMEIETERQARYSQVIDMMAQGAYKDGEEDVEGLRYYLLKTGRSTWYNYQDICYAYGQLVSRAVEKENLIAWILANAEQVMSADEWKTFKIMIGEDTIQSTKETVVKSKMDIRHGEMKQGNLKPALRTDIATEQLQHMRDEGLSYDKIAEAVGMSKSGVAARLKGYKPKNQDK